MALVTTVGSASANSYISATDATTYFTSLGLSSDWSTYGSEAALLRGMLWLESRDFMGSRANNDSGTGVYQALEFPRSVTFYRGADQPFSGTTWTDKLGRRWDDDEVPTPIKDAQCWAAMAAGIEVTQLGTANEAVSEIRTGRVTVKMGDSLLVKKANYAKQQAAILVRPFLASAAGRAIRT